MPFQTFYEDSPLLLHTALPKTPLASSKARPMSEFVLVDRTSNLGSLGRRTKDQLLDNRLVEEISMDEDDEDDLSMAAADRSWNDISLDAISLVDRATDDKPKSSTTNKSPEIQAAIRADTKDAQILKKIIIRAYDYVRQANEGVNYRAAPVKPAQSAQPAGLDKNDSAMDEMDDNKCTVDRTEEGDKWRAKTLKLLEQYRDKGIEKINSLLADLKDARTNGEDNEADILRIQYHMGLTVKLIAGHMAREQMSDFFKGVRFHFPKFMFLADYGSSVHTIPSEPEKVLLPIRWSLKLRHKSSSLSPETKSANLFKDTCAASKQAHGVDAARNAAVFCMQCTARIWDANFARDMAAKYLGEARKAVITAASQYCTRDITDIDANGKHESALMDSHKKFLHTLTSVINIFAGDFWAVCVTFFNGLNVSF